MKKQCVSAKKKEQSRGVQYRYYSTLRPIDLGTFPNPTNNRPVEIKNFDSRIPVEDGAILAWGELIYNKPLTQEQLEGYELLPAGSNDL